MLPKCAFALLVNVLVPNCTIADENTYSIPALGFTITKPEEWHFMSVAEVNENLQRAEFQDEEFDAFIKAHSVAPIVTITKYKEPFDELNPSVKVYIKPLRGLPREDTIKLLEIFLMPVSKAFLDYKIVTKPQETEIAGLKSAHVSLDAKLKFSDGQKYPTRSEIGSCRAGKYS